MAGKKKPSVKTVAVVPQGPSKNTVGTSGSNMTKKKANPQQRLMPAYTVEQRRPPFLGMLMDPVNSNPALPPVSLPARAIPLKQYQEVLLSTDAAGNCGLTVQPLMASQYFTVATWTGTTMATFSTGQNNAEYASFTNNFASFVPLCCEVIVKFTGNDNNVAGRIYGIVAQGGNNDVSKFPLEPNGCEGMTSEGISCTWYSTSPVWANPTVATQASLPTEWLDCTIACAMVGGPVSMSNIVSVGIYFHLAAFPKSGICGLTPMASLPDPSLQYLAALLNANEEGLGGSSMSLKRRDKFRNHSAKVRDVLKVAGKVVGTVFPQASGALSVAEALAHALSQ